MEMTDQLRPQAILFILSMIVTAQHITGSYVCPDVIPHNCTCTVLEDHGILDIDCISLGLTALPTDFPVLNELRIENNNIPVLAPIPYSNLQYLYLELNRIYGIADNAFRNLSQLKTLNMADNQITELPPETFLGLKSLKSLSLAGNPMYHISTGVLGGHILPSLETLDLANCRIYEISPLAFDRSSPMLSLNVSLNRLSSFEFIRPLKGLRFLDLSHNRIQRLVDAPFRGLTSLDDVDLSFNKITHLGLDSFQGLIRLKSLYLHHNQITQVDHSAFKDTLSLKTLDISHNLLQHLNRDRFPWSTLEKPMVHNNPWECGCKTAWLRSSEVLLSNLESNLTCAGPIEVRGAAVYSINLNFFHCRNVQRQASERALAIGLGVVIGLIIASLAALLVYRLVFRARRRSRDGPLTVAASSPYSRVDSRELVLKSDDM